MRIHVLFFGMLKDIVGRAEDRLTVEDGSSISRLFDLYATRFPKLAAHSSSLLFSRNQEFADRGARLEDGDEVAFLPPVSGGSDNGAPGETATGERNPCRLTREPIDTRALAAELQRGEDGAVVVFEGIVRNHSKGRATRFLEYEAYEPMALAKMREIAAEVPQKFAVDRVGITHRLGRLEIGEASVVIVVTAAHRKPAFEACHYAIDRLKRIVPIWKKEFFEDGEVWVEGEPGEYAVSRP
ncbi:MAG: molybdenum cofactor biosynthesis protein MoaE [Terriglobia bacterium]